MVTVVEEAQGDTIVLAEMFQPSPSVFRAPSDRLHSGSGGAGGRPPGKGKNLLP